MTKTVNNSTDPAFVVYGVDADKKPRAARFDNSHPELVAKAAELMGLKLYEVRSPTVAALAKRLPIGRLYANGNGFVPSVKKDLYATLAGVIAAASGNGGTDGAGGAAGKDASPGLPRSWDEIAPGHLVIASEGPGNGWWDAVVVDVNGDMLTLHWRDFPWQPDVVQHRSSVALIKPAQ
jgi:hypothetical protein